MTDAEKLYLEIGQNIKAATQGYLFGKSCFQINGKAFICFFKDEMVFKLPGDTHIDALQNNGALLFDPSGKKRPMKEWVQVPFTHKNKWKKYAEIACNYVSNL